MTQSCDDDDAMVRQCDGDGAMTRWRWYNGDEAMLYRTIVIALSHHRHIDLFAHVMFEQNRAIVFAPSLYRSIDLKSMMRWYDSELRGPIRTPYSQLIFQRMFLV